MIFLFHTSKTKTFETNNKKTLSASYRVCSLSDQKIDTITFIICFRAETFFCFFMISDFL